jgi:hypothetical protein
MSLLLSQFFLENLADDLVNCFAVHCGRQKCVRLRRQVWSVVALSIYGKMANSINFFLVCEKVQ